MLGFRNTGNAIAEMAQVGISYMSKFGRPPGINFGAKSITSQIPFLGISVLIYRWGFIIHMQVAVTEVAK